MGDTMFTEEDLALIRRKGMSIEDVQAQVEAMQKGFPRIELDRACTLGDGILQLKDKEMERLGAVYEEEARSGRAMKFVPASGAASRMFKVLQSARNHPGGIRADDIARKAEDGDEESAKLVRFFSGLRGLALYDSLRSAMAEHGIDADDCMGDGNYQDILDYLLGPEGLDAANLPKGLIPFHAYPDGTNRTPFEEHMVEACITVRDQTGRAMVHFTASPEHEKAIRSHLEEKRPVYEGPDTHLVTDVSIQMPHTDTIALEMDGRPFRDENGRLLFRPGGHGALLENLNMLQGDLVFIKNIDNIVPDRMKQPTVSYKKALGGLLIKVRQEAAMHVNALAAKKPSGEALDRAFDFVVHKLSAGPPSNLSTESVEEKRDFLLSRLNRPIRVCGMVRNEGEPGGGPFWVRHKDGSLSLQIVEASQVDMGSPAQKSVWTSSTHFNPVDLVCSLRDFRGRPFDLRQYRDPETGFVSLKSSMGRDLKALELPGLWNGAMAWWNTIFVEVPLETFNPVKTVLDLLRDEHRIT